MTPKSSPGCYATASNVIMLDIFTISYSSFLKGEVKSFQRAMGAQSTRIGKSM